MKSNKITTINLRNDLIGKVACELKTVLGKTIEEQLESVLWIDLYNNFLYKSSPQVQAEERLKQLEISIIENI